VDEQGHAHRAVVDAVGEASAVEVPGIYRAEADGMRVEEVIRRLVAAVPVPVKTA
jgi:hypothetical protein